MGRRKKDDIVSYVQIISSSYVQKTEYEKAQVAFSAALDEEGNIRTDSMNAMLGIEAYNLDEIDDVFD